MVSAPASNLPWNSIESRSIARLGGFHQRRCSALGYLAQLRAAVLDGAFSSAIPADAAKRGPGLLWDAKRCAAFGDFALSRFNCLIRALSRGLPSCVFIERVFSRELLFELRYQVRAVGFRVFLTRCIARMSEH